MNKRLIKASVAGAAALALAAGGTTFAAWTDFDVESTGAGAGIMKLTVSDRDGTAGIQAFSLAPGQNKFQEFYLASADADNVPSGVLTAKIQNLVDSEDKAECTTFSEAIAEGSGTDGSGEPSDMGACGAGGELSDEARVQILASQPVNSPSDCPNSGIYQTVFASPGGTGTGTLASQLTKTFNLGTLEKGQGVCVRMEMSLPADASNATQGDDVSWDWRFNLTQS